MTNKEINQEIAKLKAKKDVIEFEIHDKVYACAAESELAPLYMQLEDIYDRLGELQREKILLKKEVSE